MTIQDWAYPSEPIFEWICCRLSLDGLYSSLPYIRDPSDSQDGFCRVIANAWTLYVIFYFLNACSKLLNREWIMFNKRTANGID